MTGDSPFKEKNPCLKFKYVNQIPPPPQKKSKKNLIQIKKGNKYMLGKKD